jgi:hypothetical protein
MAMTDMPSITRIRRLTGDQETAAHRRKPQLMGIIGRYFSSLRLRSSATGADNFDE